MLARNRRSLTEDTRHNRQKAEPPVVLGGTHATSCVPGDDEPKLLYLHIGFTPTGDLDEKGEVILALQLGT